MHLRFMCRGSGQFLPTPHVGVNPRGVRPLQVWQMDVTHISSFGRNQYLHVSIDTCSGVMFATPLTGEKASHVIQHCLEAWSAWGKTTILKTDNWPVQRGLPLLSALPKNWEIVIIDIKDCFSPYLCLICLGSFLCILQEIGLKDSMRPLRP